MPRSRRRFRRRTYRLRRRWHRLARPLRRPARVLAMASVLTVVAVGTALLAVRPFETTLAVPVRLGPDSTVVVDGLRRGDFALAGLRDGDRVLAVAGAPISRARAARMDQISKGVALGDTLALEVEREGRVRALAAVAGRQEAEDARRFGLASSAVDRGLRALLVLALAAFALGGAALFARARARGYEASLGLAMAAVPGLFVFEPLSETDLAGVLGPAAAPVIGAALLMATLAVPIAIGALVRFPDGRYGPRWSRRTGRVLGGWAAAFVVAFVVAAEALAPIWLRIGIAAAFVFGVLATPVVALVQKYVGTDDAVVRQQMKWVLLPLGALTLLFLGTVLGESVPALDSARTATGYLFDTAGSGLVALALAAVPLGVLAGTLNFRPWDADLWIARSAAVGAATLGLAATFAGGAEALRLALRASMGEGAEAVAAALAAVVALLVFNPVREWLTRRADADLHRTRDRLTERLPLLLAGRQVVATPEEIGRVAIAAVREALATDRAAVLDLDPEGWEVVAAEGVAPEAALAWAEGTLDPAALPPASEQVWEDPLFVLRVPLRSAEDEVVGVLALGTHGEGRGYSTEERKALDAASRSLAEALRVAERRVEAEARQHARLARLVDRLVGDEE